MREVRAVLLVILGIGLGFVVFNGRAFSQEGSVNSEAAVALGSGFTYQGQLIMDGDPAEGSYDLRFSLYDAAAGGGQVGSTVTRADVSVVEGRFTVALDFGASAFDGQERWLEVAVREGSSAGAYTTLAPRQALTAAPYALYSSSAPWSGLTGVPAGLDDGDDDTTYTAGTGLLLSGTEFSTEGVPFDNMGVVAKSGGDFSSIQAGIDFIDGLGDAAADNPYLLYVAPGVYEERVTLIPYVTLVGSGEGTTIIRWTGGEQAPWEGTGSATLVGADNASVRHLTVESDGTGKTFSVALLNRDADTSISHVTAIARGSTDSRGLANYDGSAATISNVTAIAVDATRNHALTNDGSAPHINDATATASGGDFNYGVINWGGASAKMTDLIATASGGNESFGIFSNSASTTMINITATAEGATDNNFGVYNWNGSSPTMMNVVATAAGGVTAYGVFNLSSSSPQMTGITATGLGNDFSYGVFSVSSSPVMNNMVVKAANGSTSNFGVLIDDASLTMTDVTVNSAGPGSNNIAIDIQDSSIKLTNVSATAIDGSLNRSLSSNASSLTIRHSALEGSTNSVYRSGGTVQVASSQLNGPVASGLVCFDNYDENLNAVVCP